MTMKKLQQRKPLNLPKVRRVKRLVGRNLIALRIVPLARKAGADKLVTMLKELWRYKLVPATRGLQPHKETWWTEWFFC